MLENNCLKLETARRVNALKALCIADLHAEPAALDFLEKFLEAEKPALVIAAGDLTNRGPLEYAERVLALIEESGARALAVHGNFDSIGVKTLLEKHGASIHRKAVEVGGTRFVGYGGSNPTPNFTEIEYSEKQIYEELAPLVSRECILVSHAPPFNTKADVARNLRHVGSHSIRRIIDEKHPRACVCAHIHEAEGEQNVLGCKVIKLPALKNRGALLFDPATLETRFLEPRSEK